MKIMKYIAAILVVFVIADSIAQTNSYPPTGDVQIKTGKLYIENSASTVELITIKDLRYTPNLLYKFGTQSDGLQIRQDDNLNYHFKTGGDFLVYNGKIGIGTYTPAGKLHIEKTGGSTEALLTFKDLRYSPYQVYNFVTESDGLQIRQDNTINYQFKSGGNFIVNNGSVGIGTTDLTPEAKLTVAGLIHSREVKVSIDAGADFVFKNDYDLKSLDEVDQFIKLNKHLPEIQPANEMEKNGIEVGKMEIKLLQKIEELTLYLIEMNSEMKAIRKEHEQMQAELRVLKQAK